MSAPETSSDPDRTQARRAAVASFLFVAVGLSIPPALSVILLAANGRRPDSSAYFASMAAIHIMAMVLGVFSGRQRFRMFIEAARHGTDRPPRPARAVRFGPRGLADGIGAVCGAVLGGILWNVAGDAFIFPDHPLALLAWMVVLGALGLIAGEVWLAIRAPVSALGASGPAVTCGRCGEELEPDDATCPMCGTPAPRKPE